MLHELKRGILFTLVTMLLFGGGYHALVWAIGRNAFAEQAEGSLIRGADGTVIGSRLIAQASALRSTSTRDLRAWITTPRRPVAQITVPRILTI
jgi:K+-transporting ATPase c subunit